MKKLIMAVLVLAMVFMAFGCAKAPAPDGILSSFKATDLDGNTVDQTVFSGYKLTMINVWGTFCGPCISEMPEIGALNRNLTDQGFQVVGIVVDAGDGTAVDESVVKTAGDIIEQTGADYLHILPSTDLTEGYLDQVMYVPTTIFVDEYGNQVGDEYVGAKDYEDWAGIIEELLGEVG